jgi:hypothetical protein
MGASVGYLEAWGLWWQGIDLKPMQLYGFPMIWVGRIAKIATFIAGLTILLDIVGPDRIFEYSNRVLRPRSDVEGKDRKYSVAIFATPVVALTVVLFLNWPTQVIGNEDPDPLLGLLIIVGILSFILWAASVLAIAARLLAKALDSHSGLLSVRWTCAAMLAVGFSFDLLTS